MLASIAPTVSPPACPITTPTHPAAGHAPVKGLAPAEIEALPGRLRLGAEDIASLPHSQACAVCLESFEPGEEARCV